MSPIRGHIVKIQRVIIKKTKWKMTVKSKRNEPYFENKNRKRNRCKKSSKKFNKNKREIKTIIKQMKSKIFVMFSTIKSAGNKTICWTNLNTTRIHIPNSDSYFFLSHVLIYFIFPLICILTFAHLNIIFISDYIIFTWISFFRISKIILRKKFLFFFSSVRNS